MTSLIFWGPYLAHKGVVNHRREKQKAKNYERWESLRDEYDEQRKVTRESISLDSQRTGLWDPLQQNPNAMGRQIVGLRDLQEANDTRTGWRTQEHWDPSKTQLQTQVTGYVQQNHLQDQQHYSAVPSMNGHMKGFPTRPQMPGAAWDEGLPAPLQVSRRSFDDYEYPEVRQDASVSSPRPRQPRQPRAENNPREAILWRTPVPSGLGDDAVSTNLAQQVIHPGTPITTFQELAKNEFGFVEPGSQVPGGRMAELIESGY